jgi:hypothetical protein
MTERIDTTFWRRSTGDVAVVFVHGFLDDGHVWDRTIAALTTAGIETVQRDLAGSVIARMRAAPSRSRASPLTSAPSSTGWPSRS